MPNTSKKVFQTLVSKTKIYLVIIAVLLIALCFYEPNFITPSILLFILISMYAYWTNGKRKAEISKHIEELTYTVDSAAKSTLINSPFALIIAETDGNIIWKSKKFVEEFATIDISNYLNNILKEMKLHIEDNPDKTNKSVEKELKIGEKDYYIVGEYVKSKERKNSEEYMTTLYFLEQTEQVELRKKYQAEKLCVGIIMIDNYEELVQRIEAEDRPQIMAKIEKEIYDWASKTGGLVVKSERDTFVYILEKQYMEMLEESKFNILDEVKEINIPEKMQATLSIAISNEGDTYYEKYKSASAIIDIALGRGGDQAIVKQDGKYSFFGGSAQEVEKRTKVKARIVAHALEELMQETKDIIIMGHMNGDMDSIGSSFGLYRLAKTLGKDAYVVAENYGASIQDFLDKVKEKEEYAGVVLNKAEALSKISPETLLIVTDTHKKGYVDVPELLEKTNRIVVIDHHRRSTDYIDTALLTFHEVYASSASELVTEILQYAETEVPLTELEVEALYAGIVVDTKSFTFKTGVRTFEAAAYLRKCGVDIIRVKKWFQSDLDSYRVISDIVKNAEVIYEKIGISVYDVEDKNANLICAKAADELLEINNITASFVIGKLGDKVCISGRSIGDINVQIILEKLGGGGHITLAGAQVEGMTIEDTKQELINRINEYFSEIAG